MPSSLGFSDHLEGLRSALVSLVRYADRAGLETACPTTPDWTVRSLVAHQGMVHRWATALVRGEPVDPDALTAEGRAAPDPLDWLRDGAVELARALTAAPDDLQAPVFLADAPAPKPFWARRQCHETTMHAVDALGAALGRYPRSADTWIPDDLALDGIDELLCGFVARPRSRLRAEDPFTLAVRATGTDRGWTVRVSDRPPVSSPDPDPDGDVVLDGSPVALYLTLWNRSDEVTALHESGDWWREGAIRWDR